MLSKITPRQLKASRLPDKDFPPPEVNVDPLCSNIYNVSERIVLSWMNDLYTNYKERVWHNSQKGLFGPRVRVKLCLPLLQLIFSGRFTYNALVEYDITTLPYLPI